MKRIQFSNHPSFFIVDGWAYDLIKDIRWWRHHSGYATTKMAGKSVTLHQLLVLHPGGFSICVDHINRNRSDNRVSNLRLISRSLNAVNVTLKTKYRGVSFHKKNRRWVAYLGRLPRVYLGSFATKSAAAKAYNKAAFARWGNIAILNKGLKT